MAEPASHGTLVADEDFDLGLRLGVQCPAWHLLKSFDKRGQQALAGLLQAFAFRLADGFAVQQIKHGQFILG